MSPGQTHQVSWLDSSNYLFIYFIIFFLIHLTSSRVLSKVLVKPWSLLSINIKVYLCSRGLQIQCASIEPPSTLRPLLYFHWCWPSLYCIFSYFSHIHFLHFFYQAFTVDSKARISSRRNAFLMWLRKNVTGSAVIDRNNHGSVVHTHCIAISCCHCHKDGRVVVFLIVETLPLNRLPETFCAHWRQQPVVEARHSLQGQMVPYSTIITLWRLHLLHNDVLCKQNVWLPRSRPFIGFHSKRGTLFMFAPGVLVHGYNLPLVLVTACQWTTEWPSRWNVLHIIIYELI